MGINKYIKHTDKNGEERWIAIPYNTKYAMKEMWDPDFLLKKLAAITAPATVSSQTVQINSKYTVLKVKYTYSDEQDRGDFSIDYDYKQSATGNFSQQLQLNVYDFFSKETLAQKGSCEFTLLISNFPAVTSATNVNAEVKIDFITSNYPSLMIGKWKWDTTKKNLLAEEGPENPSLSSHTFTFGVDDDLNLFIYLYGCQAVEMRTSFDWKSWI